MVKITNKMTKEILKDIHAKRIKAIVRYYEQKTKEKIDEFNKPIAKEVIRRLKIVEGELNDLLKYYDVKISAPTYSYYSFGGKFGREEVEIFKTPINNPLREEFPKLKIDLLPKSCIITYSF